MLTFKEGQTFESQFLITQDDINKFAQLSSDYNPIHIDENYGNKTIFGHGTISHGMYVMSKMSACLANLVDTSQYYVIYLKQDTDFLKPVRPNDVINVILYMNHDFDIRANKTLDITVEIENQNKELVVSGQAKIMIEKLK